MPFRFNKCEENDGKSIDCPSCHSNRIYRNGMRETENGSIQRYICRDCGHRFSKTPVLSIRFNNIESRQVCALLTEAINLIAVEPPKVGLAGATEQNKTDAKDIIFEYAWWLKKQGRAETTITSCRKLLSVMVKRGANLYDPESIKDVIARQEWSQGRKENAVDAYSNFLRMIGSKWEPPRYRRKRNIPYIPTETEIDQLIAGCSRKNATVLQMLKETGMRPGEAWLLKWTYIDFTNNSVRIDPEKGSNPRQLKISNKLVAMLNALPRKSEYVFKNGLLNHFTDGFRQQRKRLAVKLENPRINQISFRTLRHWKATMEYHRTRDIKHVQHLLGHKNIMNTDVYTHYMELEDDEFISKIAKTAEEASQLVEAGFDYVCTASDGLMVFKKRK